MAAYGKVGHPGGYYMAPHLAAANGCIEMQSYPPSCYAIAQADGTWLEPPVDTMEARKAAYKEEADNLYMDYQASIAEGKDDSEIQHTLNVWLIKRAEIKARYPK